MKLFLSKLSLFIFIMVLIFILGVLLPPTPRASISLLFSQMQKDSLLVHTKSPRIILVGGSNLSFGLNSQLIKDALALNPINTSIQADIGLIYMMDHVLPFIQSGDIVVIAPEYGHFYGNTAYGNAMLLRTIMDVTPSDARLLRKQQWANISKSLVGYSLSKLKPNQYFFFNESDLYGVNSYNEYGDVYTHWELTQQKFPTINPISEQFNDSVITELYNFK